jgi:cytoskeleton protein RodZ
MALTLGEKLRQAREERGISISEVAEQTRISPLYLKSIEKDDYKPLPGGIFNKGFVRSYARYIGFDEEEALRDFAELMAQNEIAIEAEQKVYRPEVLTDDRSVRSVAPSIIVALVVLGMLAFGVIYLVRYLTGSTTATNVQVATNTTPETAPSVTFNPPLAASPAAAFTVELKAGGERVWVGYTLDGSTTDKTLEPDEAVRLDVQNSLKLTYARVKAQSLELSVNGRRINVPTASAKGNLEITIDKSNVAQIMQAGEIGGPAPAKTVRPTPRPTAAQPAPRPTAATAVTPTPKRPTE